MIKSLMEKEIPSATKWGVGKSSTPSTLYSLQLLNTGWENTELIASLNSYNQVLTEPVCLPGLHCRFNKAAAYCL